MCTKYPYVAMISDFAKIGIIKVQFNLLILKNVKKIFWYLTSSLFYQIKILKMPSESRDS
jgi:hypothetical protein